MTKIYKVLGKRGRVTIPHEIRRSVGFSYNDILSFCESEDGRTVVVRREKICEFPSQGMRCSGKCGKTEDEVTLLDFLNNLTDEEQRAALIHLSVRWAEKQGGGGLA